MVSDANAAKARKLRALAARAREIGIALPNRDDVFTLLDYARELETQAEALEPLAGAAAQSELPADTPKEDALDAFRHAEGARASEFLRDRA